jgi:SAM-dependent methyltransferase
MGPAKALGAAAAVGPAPAWRPHALALQDYFRGAHGAEVVVRGTDGEEERVPAAVFFRGPAEFSALEEAAVERCAGRVLDIGAGAGSHSLVLQARGLPVVALDIAPEAVEVMRARGVEDARCGDLFQFTGERFDTLLLLMNGAGIGGTLEGLDRFLRFIPSLLSPGGQALMDSYDMTDLEPIAPGRYPGEMRFQLEYGGVSGAFYDWLFVDLATLSARARRAGLSCEGIWHEAEGHYLARLALARAKPGREAA